MAFGGNFYAIVDAAAGGRRGRPGAGRRARRARRGRDGGDQRRRARPVHPDDERIAGCHHVIFHAPGRDGADARAATSIHPGWLDRSPCGTGTSARMAQLHARGELAIGAAVRQRVGRSARASPAGSWRRPRSAGARRSCPRSPAAPGSPGWASTCSTPRTRSRPGSRCERGRRAATDVVVVGAGIVGAACARELAVRGVRGHARRPRRGLERDDRAGGGQRARLRQGRRARARAHVAGLAVYDELDARLGHEAQIRRKGALIVHPDGRDVGRRARARRAPARPRACGAGCSTPPACASSSRG